MASPASPAETRAYIIERLVGDTGEPSDVLKAARGLAAGLLPALAEALAGLLGPAATLEIAGVELSRMTAARPADPTGSALAVVSSAQSPDALLVGIDAAALALCVAMAFGGDPEIATPPLSRDPTPLELGIAQLVVAAAARATAGAAPALGLAGQPEPVLSGPDLARHVLRDGPAVAIMLDIMLPRGAGRLTLTMPQRLLNPRKTGEPRSSAQGDGWGARFGEEVMRSAVVLQASMPLRRMTLAELDGLQVGDVVELAETAQTEARLAARGQTLFVCEFGKLGQNYTVRVRRPYDAGQDFIEGLLPS